MPIVPTSRGNQGGGPVAQDGIQPGVNQSGLNALSDAAAQLGDVIQQARDTKNLNSARTRMLEGVNALELDIDNSSDSSAIGGLVEDGLSGLGADINDSLPPGQQGEFKVIFDRASAGVRAFGNRRGRRLDVESTAANLSASKDLALQRWSRAENPVEANAIRQEYLEQVEAARDAGFVNAAAAQTDMQGFLSAGEFTQGAQLVDVDSKRALAIFEDEKMFTHLSPDDRLRLKNRAEGKVEDDRNADVLNDLIVDPGVAVKKLKDKTYGFNPEQNAIWLDRSLTRQRMDLRGKAASLGSEIRTLSKHLENGFDLSQENLNDLENSVRKTGNDKLLAEVAVVRDLNGFQQRIKTSTPATLQALVNNSRAAEKNGGVVSIEDGRQIILAEKMLVKMNAALKQDPISWAVRVGLVNSSPLLLAGDNAVPSMQNRVEVARKVAQQYGISPKFLTNEEKNQLTDFLAGASVDKKLAWIHQIQLGFEDAADQVFAEISPNNKMTAHAAGLSLYGLEQARSARDVLTGQDAIKEGNKILPPVQALSPGINTVMGRSMSETTEGRATTIEAAKAIYTARALQRGGIEASKLDKHLWEESLNAAVGGDGKTGGFGDFNGSEIVLPVGVSQDDFDNSMDKVTDEDLVAASVGGKVPKYANGDILTANEFRRGRLVALGDGQYLVDLSDDGRRFIQGSSENGDYIFDFRTVQAALAARHDPFGKSARIIFESGGL